MELAAEVKMAVYGYFAETGNRPSVMEISRKLDLPVTAVSDAYKQLAQQRLLVLEGDGRSIRMAPPFSGITTQHVVRSGGKRYFANCAWDALGIAAALGSNATVFSRCEQSGESLELDIGQDGPVQCSWLFHCPMPAAHWWDDIVFT